MHVRVMYIRQVMHFFQRIRFFLCPSANIILTISFRVIKHSYHLFDAWKFYAWNKLLLIFSMSIIILLYYISNYNYTCRWTTLPFHSLFICNIVYIFSGRITPRCHTQPWKLLPRWHLYLQISLTITTSSLITKKQYSFRCVIEKSDGMGARHATMTLFDLQIFYNLE